MTGAVRMACSRGVRRRRGPGARGRARRRRSPRWCRPSPISRPWRTPSTTTRARSCRTWCPAPTPSSSARAWAARPGRRALVTALVEAARSRGARCRRAGGVSGRGRRASARSPAVAGRADAASGRVPHAVSRARLASARWIPGGPRPRRPSGPARWCCSRACPRSWPPPAGHHSPSPSGNPGLATGGSGDVLSGLIGAALAQRDRARGRRGARRAGAGPRRRHRGAAGLGARSSADGCDRRAARPVARMGAAAPLATTAHPPILLELPRPLTA